MVDERTEPAQAWVPPAAVIGCSGVTCWRRLRNWTEAGVWPALHELPLAELRAAGLLDLDRCAVDASHPLKGGHDVTQLMALLDAVPPIRGRRGRPRRNAAPRPRRRVPTPSSRRSGATGDVGEPAPRGSRTYPAGLRPP